MAGYAFRDRPLNDREFERLRLALSSYRDGSGQTILRKTGESMPGGRDFERSLAAVLGGTGPENKGIFDVHIQVDTEGKAFGVSCKMSKWQPPKHESSFMELSNSAAAFRAHLLALQIHWMSEPTLAGPAIIDLVSSWHTDQTGTIDISSSRYAVLGHDSKWKWFHVLAFPLDLKRANPRGDVEWVQEGKSLNGYIDDSGRRHRLWQYYADAGGQLKYYPLLSWAEWATPPFTLECPPTISPLEKAQTYFKSLWPE